MNFLILCLVWFSVFTFNGNTIEGDGEDKPLKIEITRQTTLEELQQIKQFLKERGIDMHIERSNYNAKNQLVEIRLKVDFGGGKVKKYGAKNFKRFFILQEGDIKTKKSV